MRIVFFFIAHILLFFPLAAHPSGLDNFNTKIANSSVLDYDLIHYDFQLLVETGSRFIQGSLKIKAKSLKNALDAFEFQLHDNYAIDSILYLGRRIDFEKIAPHRKIAKLPSAIDSNAFFDMEIFYSGTAPLSTNDWGNGIVQKKETKYNADVFYTLSVPYHAYEWFPCKQVLSDMLDSVKMSVVTHKDNSVVSNGIPISDIPLLGDKHVVTWKTNYPINYYLISFNVGKYIPYHFDVDLPGKTDGKMPVMNYLYNQTSLSKQKPVLDKIPDFLSNYSEMFGLYPFHKEKFGTVVVPLSGGMEHQTIVNLATDYDKYLAAHEMAHQWWGDNVNINSYHDVWLSEGWATYSEYLTAEKLYPSEARGILDKFHNNALSQAAGQTYTVDTTNFNTIYNYNNVYMKGAAIIHTLRAEIADDSLFFAVLSDFQYSFSHQNVGVSDFKRFLEQKTGKDLELYFNQWYYGFGYPKFTITWGCNAGKLIIKSVQTTSSAKTPLFKTNVEYLIKRKNRPDTLLTVFQETNVQTFTFDMEGEVLGVVLDPRNVLINKLISNKMDSTLTSEVDLVTTGNLVSVSPNPAGDFLNIKISEDGLWNLEIYAEDGAFLMKKRI